MTATPQDRVALVTGGASGIGAAIVRRLSKGGGRVVIADIDDASGTALADEIGALYIRADVSSPRDNQDAVDAAVEHYGRLDVAVLNAGVGIPEGGLADFDADAYRRLIAINQEGVAYGIRSAIGRMTTQGSGDIIVTSSLAGVSESPINPLYASTKHAVIGLVRSVAPAVYEQGISINAFCPTFVDTPILRGAAEYIAGMGVAVLPPDSAADAVDAILADSRTGQAWLLVPNQVPTPMDFPELPSIMSDPAASPPEVP